MSTDEILRRSALGVVAARYSLDAEVDHRDALIRSAHAEGYSLRKIASLAGVSHETIRTIVAAHSTKAHS